MPLTIGIPTTPIFRYAELGVLYLQLGELQLAEEALLRSTAHNPAYGEALAYLSYVRASKHDANLDIAEYAAALTPASPAALYLVGLSWRIANQPAEARLAFERAYELDPANPAIAVEIATTHRMEQSLDWAEVWMKEALRLAPEDDRFRSLARPILCR